MPIYIDESMQPIIFHHLSMLKKKSRRKRAGFPSFFDIQHTHKKAYCCMKSFWTKWWNQISHHFTSLSFFILGPASFNETTSHQSSRQRIIKNIKHHWSKNTTQNQSNSWTCQISSELGAFPFDWISRIASHISIRSFVCPRPHSSAWRPIPCGLVWQPWNWNSKTKERKLTRVVVCQHRRFQIREPKMLVGNSKFFTAAIYISRAKCWCLKLCHALQTSKMHAVARIWMIRVEHNMLLLWNAIFKGSIVLFPSWMTCFRAIMNFEFPLTPPGTKVDGPNP